VLEVIIQLLSTDNVSTQGFMMMRMVRIMRAVPEMVTMMKGVAAAARAVFTTLSMLIMVTYIFAIVSAQQLSDNSELWEDFGTIPKSMWTLFLSGMFMDGLFDIMAKLLEHGGGFMLAVFMFYVLLSALTILNMLIGVLCEVVSAVAESEKEKVIVMFVKTQLIQALETLDLDGNGVITRDEFEQFLEIPVAADALDQLGVDAQHLALLGDVIFDNSIKKSEDGRDSPVHPHSHRKTITTKDGDVGLMIPELLERICRLRSSNKATVPDIVDLQKYIRIQSRESNKHLDQKFSSTINCLKAELKEDISDNREQMRKTQQEMQDSVHELHRKMDVVLAGVNAVKQRSTGNAGRSDPPPPVGPRPESGGVPPSPREDAKPLAPYINPLPATGCDA